jgi:hypothetical protein
LIAFHINNDPLFPGLEVSDQAQIAMCDCLTDVDQPFSIHSVRASRGLGLIRQLSQMLTSFISKLYLFALFSLAIGSGLIETVELFR